MVRAEASTAHAGGEDNDRRDGGDNRSEDEDEDKRDEGCGAALTVGDVFSTGRVPAGHREEIVRAVMSLPESLLSGRRVIIREVLSAHPPRCNVRRLVIVLFVWRVFVFTVLASDNLTYQHTRIHILLVIATATVP